MTKQETVSAIINRLKRKADTIQLDAMAKRNDALIHDAQEIQALVELLERHTMPEV